MTVEVNGEARDLPEGTTVASLLDQFGLSPQRVAVERNGAIVPRSEYENLHLSNGDRLEIVQFVGGG